MTFYYIPRDPSNFEWWDQWRRQQKKYQEYLEMDRERQSSAYGLHRLSVYSTHAHRPRRVSPGENETTEYFTSYVTNWDQYHRNGRPRLEDAPPAVSDNDLFGTDPVMDWLKVHPQGQASGPSRTNLNKRAFSAYKASENSRDVYGIIGEDEVTTASKMLALAGEDAFHPDDVLEVHAFEKQCRETTAYGAITTKNKFEQQIQIYEPRRPPIVEGEQSSGIQAAANDVQQLRRDPNLFQQRGIWNWDPLAYTLLARDAPWSKIMSAAVFNYTFEFHDFIYRTPWAYTTATADFTEESADINKEPIAKLNPEYNFYDPEHNERFADFQESHLEPINFNDSDPTNAELQRQTISNNWFGTELFSQETQSKKGQFPFYIELQMPTQPEGPILKTIRKFGHEKTILKRIADQFESPHRSVTQTAAFEMVPVLRKTSWIGESNNMVTRNVDIYSTNSTDYVSLRRATLDSLNVQDDLTKSEVQTVEFYGSKNSVFNKFYKDVIDGEEGACRTYRDRMMMVSFRETIERILGKRKNRITYTQTLPTKDIGTIDDPGSRDNLDRAPCKTETLFYRIIKRRGDNQQSVGEYFISNPEQSVLNFIDTQVKMNVNYTYEVDAFVASYGIAYRYILPPYENTGWWGTSRDGHVPLPGRLWRSRYASRIIAHSGVVHEGYQAPIFHAFAHYTPSVKIFRVPVFHNPQAPHSALPAPSKKGSTLPVVKIIDRPPAPPGVTFIPYKGNTKKILINLSDNIESIGVGSTGVRFIAFGGEGEGSEQAAFEEIHQIQKEFENFKLQPGHVEFSSEGDVERIEVYRTTEKPTKGMTESWEDTTKKPYDVFKIGGEGSEPHKIITLTEQAAFEDDIKPNTRYYYTFRSVDKNGYLSNPTAIYFVEIVEENGKVYALMNVYEPQKPKKMTIQRQNLARYLEISPAPISSEVFSRAEDLPGDRIGLVSGDDSVFGKTFKVRIRSKDTGRLVDLNVRFRTTVEENQDIGQIEQAEAEAPICDDEEEE